MGRKIRSPIGQNVGNLNNSANKGMLGNANWPASLEQENV
jgi:hypothetical protein